MAFLLLFSMFVSMLICNQKCSILISYGIANDWSNINYDYNVCGGESIKLSKRTAIKRAESSW